MFRPSHTAALHRLVPELVIWECDMLAYRGGFLRRGIVAAGILGGSGTSTSCPTTGSTAPNGTCWSPTSSQRPSTIGTSPVSMTLWRGCTAPSARPMSKPCTHTGAPPSKRRRRNSAFPWVATPAPDRPSPHYRKPSEPPFELPTRPSASYPPCRDSRNKIGESTGIGTSSRCAMTPEVRVYFWETKRADRDHREVPCHW